MSGQEGGEEISDYRRHVWSQSLSQLQMRLYASVYKYFEGNQEFGVSDEIQALLTGITSLVDHTGDDRKIQQYVSVLARLAMALEDAYQTWAGIRIYEGEMGEEQELDKFIEYHPPSIKTEFLGLWNMFERHRIQIESIGASMRQVHGTLHQDKFKLWTEQIKAAQSECLEIAKAAEK